MRPTRTIVIAGAGIGGLSAALALAKAGYRCVVLERAERLTEAGAGIQLSPNAGAALATLGIPDEAIAAVSSEPERLEIRSGRSGRRLAAMPLGERMRARFGAPYRTIHRMDLQTLLVEAVARQPDIDLELGTELAEFAAHANGVSVMAAGPARHREIRAQVLIGADGVNSAVRRAMPGAGKAAPTGRTAWRAALPAGGAPAELASEAVGLWLGPHAHLVHYAVRGGREINVVAIVKERDGDPSIERHQILKHFRGWSAAAQAIVAAPSAWRKWPIARVDPRGAWVQGPVALLGDAAHAFPPYLAQGGAFAMEDAVMLATALSRHADEPEAGLKEYEVLRRGRARRLYRAAKSAGDLYHMGPVTGWLRDIGLRTLGPLLLRRYHWIYRWQPPD